MLSRFGKVLNLSSKPSILFRAVSASSNKSANVAPAAANGPRHFPHDAPERDFVNFPPVRIGEQGGKLRIGLVPDEWFSAMYNKTGVTGPYIIFWGGVATLISKEYFVYWADTAEQIVFLGALIAGSKVYGKKLGEKLDQISNENNTAALTELEDQSKAIDAAIQVNSSLQSFPEANKLINAAKRENVALQLESVYRSRLSQVYTEVKRRLDYQVSVQGVYKRLERDQAINYIIDGVHKSIGPNQQKEAFQSGLDILKGLSQKHAGTI
jgi:F-type H+-transporting ATPase subunit b